VIVPLAEPKHEVSFHQTNLRQRFAVINVAANRIGDIDPQVIHRIGLHADGIVEGTGYVAAFGRFPHVKMISLFCISWVIILVPHSIPCLPDHFNRVAREPRVGSNDWPFLFDSLSNQ